MWRAHLIRGQGLLAALEDDPADVLISQDRGEEAQAPLAGAIALLEQPEATPVLTRARTLRDALAVGGPVVP